MPNTRVRLGSALVGATVAGLLWGSVGWAFASFVVTSVKYTAVYSAFATLVFFMIWLYLSWLILLIGASIAFYHQNPGAAAAGRASADLSPRLKEKLALLVMVLIGRRHHEGGPALAAETLVQRLLFRAVAVEKTLEVLQVNGFLVHTDDEPPGYVPARALEATALKEVLDAVRGAGKADHDPLAESPAGTEVEALIDEVDRAVAQALRERTLRGLIATDARGN